MDSPGAIGRRRGTTKVSAEDQALDQIAKEVSEMYNLNVQLILHARCDSIFSYAISQFAIS